MKKLFISEEANKQHNQRAWNEQRDNLQAIADAYHKIGLPRLLPEELAPLVSDTSVFMYKKLTGDENVQMVIGDTDKRIPIEMSKAMELTAKPQGYTELQTLIEQVKTKLVNGIPIDGARIFARIIDFKSIGKLFQMDGDGKVCITEYLAGLIDEFGNSYITSKKGLAMLAFAEAVEAAFISSGVCDMNFGQGDPQHALNAVFERWDKRAKGFVRNPRFLAQDRQWNE